MPDEEVGALETRQALDDARALIAGAQQLLPQLGMF